MIQVFLISLLQLFVSFLEEAFSAKSYFYEDDDFSRRTAVLVMVRIVRIIIR
jgi:hypothetical protein